MKTINFSGSRGITRALFVLAALGGLYYFRKRGGTFGELAAAGAASIGGVRELVNRVAPSTARDSVAANAQI